MLTTTTRSLPEALSTRGLPARCPTASSCARRTSRGSSWPATRRTRSRSRSGSRSSTTARSPGAASCCHAEVELNRRFAPSVYRGVVAIVPAPDGGLGIAPEHDPRAVDYAVVMRRYDEADTLAAQLRQRARRRAGACRPSAPPSPGSTPRRPSSRAPIDGRWTRRGRGDARHAGRRRRARPRLAALARFCRAALAAFAPQLAERARGGLRARRPRRPARGAHPARRAGRGRRRRRVRRRAAGRRRRLRPRVPGHGRRPHRRRPRPRRWCAAIAPPAATRAARRCSTFFCAVRALVRAKVDLLRAAQLDGGAAQERAGARASSCSALAERFAWRARLPHAGLRHRARRERQVDRRRGARPRRRAHGALLGPHPQAARRHRPVRARRGRAPTATPRAARSTPSSRSAPPRAVRRDGGVIVDATFRRAADADAFAAASSARARRGSSARRRPRSCSQRAAARRARDSVSDAGPAIVAGELAVYRGPFRPPGRRWPGWTRRGRSGDLLDELAATLDARLGAP